MPVRPSAFALFVMPLLALALACVGVAASDSPANPDTAAADELRVLNQIQHRHERIHKQAAPAVVAIQSRPAKTGAGFYGTGVVVSADGLVLTSSTVVAVGTPSVQVFFSDGKVFEARPVATDEATESSLLQVVRPAGETAALPFVELSDSSKAGVGELAYTAGNPFHTISRDGQVAWSVGTISGIYTVASADETSRYRGLVLETDAAVNPGSDGGPLLDGNGRLLGILSLCFCESRWLGTAVPVHLIRQAYPPLRAMAMTAPHSAAAPSGATAVASGGVPVQYADEGALAARAVPDALRVACREAAKAIVKVIIKSSDTGGKNSARPAKLSERLRVRPGTPATGVIVEAAGYVLTSASNVADDVESIEVRVGAHTLKAELLGRHFGLDVALLKVEPPPGETLPALALADDPALEIGRFVTILGASEDSTGPTQTTGIVSALERLGGCAVQTDALVNYGNTGGPVIDLRGRLVGLAAHLWTQTDWSQQNSGVGFFTQSDKIVAAMTDLKAKRDMKAPAGFFVEPKSPGAAADGRGIKVEDVVRGSVAENAKLQAGDTILAVDGMDTQTPAALVRVLQAHKAGDTIEITYKRGTETRRVQTVLTAR
jgi:S1-C subfamily serine protease